LPPPPHATDCPRGLIVTLGDLGRSPRMINHARALRARGWAVTLAGYGENPPPPDLAADPAVRVFALDARWGGFGLILWRLAAELRRERWTAVLVQNPPGFPVLAVLGLAGRRGPRRILDWHNTGSSVLSLRPWPRRHAAGLYGWCERRLAGIAHEHWTVSAAMAEKLAGIRAVVVHDRPSRIFRAAAGGGPAGDRLAWWRRILPEVAPPTGSCWVVAPSSWGPDEDSDAILRVAKTWRNNASSWGDAPQVSIIATGRGPRQAAFARAARALAAGPVEVRTAWVPAAEYPALLARADAGLCLHRSSSGLDLPIKLADFRGAGKKALVLDYGPVLTEIFRPGSDGWTFRSDGELAAGLRNLSLMTAAELTTVPAPEDTWETEWDRRLGPWAAALEAGRGQA
jgi:beta-1,4-mannosyltransferase